MRAGRHDKDLEFALEMFQNAVTLDPRRARVLLGRD
jgi:hypothetical protein